MLKNEAKIRFDDGMSVRDAARDIDLGAFADWGESERIYLNVNSLYREFGSSEVVEDVMELFAEMGQIWEGKGKNEKHI